MAEKVQSRVKLTATGNVLNIIGLIFKFAAPFAAAIWGYVYTVESVGARVSYTVVFALAILLIGAKIYIGRKIDGLRSEVANYRAEANISGGERLSRSIAFYKQKNLILNIFDNLMYVGLIGLFYMVSLIAEKGLAKLAYVLGMCFFCVLAGAILSIIGRNLIKGDCESEESDKL